MNPTPILIKNGSVLTGNSIQKTDILIDRGKFSRIEPSIKPPDSRVEIIDADGKMVFPGIIDPHTHFALQQGINKTSDHFDSGSKAAVAGGVTFFIDYTMQIKGKTLKDSLTRRTLEAQGKSYIDYAFHIGITDWNRKTQEQAKDLIDSGFPSFKMFLIYEDKGWNSEDADIFDALNKLGPKGGIIEVHCENDSLIKLLTERLMNDNHLSVKYHPLSSPEYVEGEAINRMIYLNRFAEGKLYIVHISSRLGAEAIKAARQQNIPVFAETCPQYLVLDNSVFRGEDAALFATSPPVRAEEGLKDMWEMIDREIFNVIATDHCSFNSAKKFEHGDDFRKMAFGIPGVETSFPLIYTEGYCKRKIELEKIARLMCENPAEIFGIIGRGKIKEGYFADLFIFDPEKEFILTPEFLIHPSDYSPYNGRKVRGIPETVIAKGEIKLSNRKIIGNQNGSLTKRFINTS